MTDGTSRNGSSARGILVLTSAILLLVYSVSVVGAHASFEPASSVPPRPSDGDHGQGWTEATGAVRPPAVAGAMMAYSPTEEVFVLFGGSDGDPRNETWILDPETRTWTQLHPIVSPPARADGMLVYDSAADALILFGGWYETPGGGLVEYYERLQDTWVFFVSNSTWIERNPITRPPARSDAAVAYDETQRVTLLFGGFDGTNYLGDMWSYEYRNDTWLPRPSPVLPSPRADGRMVYDAEHESFFLFSGNDYSDPDFNFHHLGDMWRYRWTENRWVQLFPDVMPVPRDYPVFATNTRFGELLLTGGYGNRTILGDIWSFNTTNLVWRNITGSGGPAPRMAAVGDYDPERNVLALFGGGDDEETKSDTWFFRYPPPLEGNIFVSSPDPVVGQSVAFTSQIRGGSGSFARLSWDFGDGETADGHSTAHVFKAEAAYRIEFVAQDIRGEQFVRTLNLTVGMPRPAWLDGSVLLVLGVAAAAIFVFVMMKRRRKSAN